MADNKAVAKMTGSTSTHYHRPDEPEFWEQRAVATKKMLANVDRQFTRLDLQRKQLVEDIAEAEAKAQALRKGKDSA